MDDRNKTFRTRFICVWLLMNAIRERTNLLWHLTMSNLLTPSSVRTVALAITRLGAMARSR